MSNAYTVDQMEAQARRHLDGSRVNTDRMALNVIELVRQVRALQQQRHAEQAPDQPEPKTYSSAKAAIDDMLRGAGLG